MKSHSRKLQLQSPYADMSSQPTNSHHTTTIPPPPQPQPTLKLPPSNPPFDSSVALTALVLLTALFFLGFLSIYIRRFSSAPPPEFTPHHPPSNHHPSRAAAGGSHNGLDPEVIKSLPVYSFYHGEPKYQTEECAVCLGEFEERERVKIIPYCKHVFHLDCIDTWLKMHVTCPVCRGTKLIEVKRSSGVIQG